MTALAGIWNFGFQAVEDVPAMLEAQSEFGPHAQSVARLGPIAAGRGLFRLLPEDGFDSQPYLDASRGLMLVADVRLDNRNELFDALNLRRAADISDAELLFRGYLQWGDDVVDRLLGDFAFAAWNEAREVLTLVRDPAGQRPLHYHRGDGFVAFASMPAGLHALSALPREPDRKQLARFVAGVPRHGSATYFAGLERVEPAQLLTISREGVQARIYWQRPTREIRYPKQDDYVEAYREQLDRATRARLRGGNGAVGAHLSAGLDSGAVASTAAKLLRGQGRVVAFTSAPRLGFNGPVPSGRLADESGPAAAVAALHDNMEHVVLRSAGASPLHHLQSASRQFQAPLGHPCNFVWWSAISGEAQARGLTVMLTGEAGNLTISAGGLAVLADLVRSGRLIRWLGEARALKRGGYRWRGLVAASVGPWLPPSLRNLLRRSAQADGANGLGVLAADLRTAMELAAEKESRDAWLALDDRSMRWRLLRSSDPGVFRKGALARWGLDERDPTTDRRLAEFCLSLPPDQLLAGGTTRHLARVALADRLPATVLHGPRGYQFADWYEAIDRQRLEEAIAELGRSETAAAVLNIDYMQKVASSWPGQNLDRLETIGTYRMGLLTALSAGIFAAGARK